MKKADRIALRRARRQHNKLAVARRVIARLTRRPPVSAKFERSVFDEWTVLESKIVKQIVNRKS